MSWSVVPLLLNATKNKEIDKLIIEINKNKFKNQVNK